jgi:hypothetical protein
MNLVNKKQGADFKIPILFGTFDYLFNIGFMSGDGGKFDEISVEFFGNNASQGGFAGAGRSPED